jgi:thiol-disulfide isomerase/thioredoxin
VRKLFFLLVFIFLLNPAFSQATKAVTDTFEYIRKGIIPAFTVYKAPDSTAFTNNDLQQKKPTLIMIFSPDCGHCQHETTLLLQNISHFTKTQILMVTWLPFSDMMSFYKTYKIADYPEITMGWDNKYFFLPYFHVQMYPGLVAFDKKGKLVKSFSGDIKMEDVWKALGQK